MLVVKIREILLVVGKALAVIVILQGILDGLLRQNGAVELVGGQTVQGLRHGLVAQLEGLNEKFVLGEGAMPRICLLAGGDARSALTTLELAGELAQSRRGGRPGPTVIEESDVCDATPARAQRYDKGGDEHYDVVSAFIKSMRGSDPDAAVYYLARMLEGGEDPKFIARRIFILASEDIGNADPQALLIAEAAFRATEVIGMPECRIDLAQAAVYMALAPKSNASYLAIGKAIRDVRDAPARAVPDHLRDRHRPGSENYGDYLYPHDHPGHWVEQQYLPDGLSRGCFYAPGDLGWEQYRCEYARRSVDGRLILGHAADAAEGV